MSKKPADEEASRPRLVAWILRHADWPCGRERQPVAPTVVAEPDHQCVAASCASSMGGPCLCPGAWESAARTAAGPSWRVLLWGCNGADGYGEGVPALGRQGPRARPATDIGQDIQQHEPLPWPQRRQMEQMVGRDLDNLGIHALRRVQGMLQVVIDEHPPSLPSRRPMPRGEGRGGPGRGKGICSGYARKSVARRKRLKNNWLQARSFMPIATKIHSELIRCPKKVLRSHTQKPLILQASHCANTLAEQAYFAGRTSL